MALPCDGAFYRISFFVHKDTDCARSRKRRAEELFLSRDHCNVDLKGTLDPDLGRIYLGDRQDLVHVLIEKVHDAIL